MMKRLLVLLTVLLAQPALAATPSRPALYALVVGVSTTKAVPGQLRYAAKDAADLAAALQAQAGKAFRTVEVRKLTDAEATKDGILDGLDWLARQTTARDVALVFLAGQGVDEPRTGRYYFLPSDGALRAVKRTLLSSADVHDALASIPGKALVLLDACRPGELGERKLQCTSDIEWVGRAPAPGERPVSVIAASTGGQGVTEDQTLGNGALTKALLEAFSGAADPHRTGTITADLLEHYVVGRVREATHGAQVPVTANLDALGGLTLAQVR